MATSLPAPALMIPPRVDLDGDDPSTIVRGTPEWLQRAALLRGALEAHGCVSVECRRRVQQELRERMRMLVAMGELFALPVGTKRRIGDADSPYKAFGAGWRTGCPASCGVFLQPSKNHVVDAPQELVTADAPRRFRPFAYEDYLRFKHAAGNGEDVLNRFAGMY